jgi:hypothetical protein
MNGDVIRWHYDKSGNGIGRLSSVSDPTGANCPGGVSEEYVYDEMGEIIKELN